MSDTEGGSSSRTPGQLLVQARDAQGLSVKYVADQLRLTPAYVTALEAGEYTALPAEPFILGYLRAYAKLLGIEPELLIRVYHQSRYGEQPPEPAPRVNVKETSEKLKKAVKLPETAKGAGGQTAQPKKSYFYLISVIVLLGAWVLFATLLAPTENNSFPMNNLIDPVLKPSVIIDGTEVDSTEIDSTHKDSTEGRVGQTGKNHNTLTGDKTNPAQDNASKSPSGEEASGSSEAVSAINASLSAQTTTNVDTEKNTAADRAVADKSFGLPSAPQPALSETLDELVIRFSGECWLEVTDANGDVLVTDLFQSGDSTSLKGVSPFSVMFGNVRATDVFLNGEPVTINASGGRNTLRTKISAAQ